MPIEIFNANQIAQDNQDKPLFVALGLPNTGFTLVLPESHCRHINWGINGPCPRALYIFDPLRLYAHQINPNTPQPRIAKLTCQRPGANVQSDNKGPCLQHVIASNQIDPHAARINWSDFPTFLNPQKLGPLSLGRQLATENSGNCSDCHHPVTPLNDARTWHTLWQGTAHAFSAPKHLMPTPTCSGSETRLNHATNPIGYPHQFRAFATMLFLNNLAENSHR